MDSTSAKNFLISRVIEQAEKEHVQLSKIEKKMLYFAEETPSLPDIYEVNAEFDRNYDTDEYEAKISQLLRKARYPKNHETSVREQDWRDALDALEKEDHYILVMVEQAFGSGTIPRANIDYEMS